MLKKLVSAIMTEEQFWEIIENSNKGDYLKNELSKLSKEEVFGYSYWWDYFDAESYNQALWAVAYTIGDSFMKKVIIRSAVRN